MVIVQLCNRSPVAVRFDLDTFDLFISNLAHEVHDTWATLISSVDFHLSRCSCSRVWEHARERQQGRTQGVQRELYPKIAKIGLNN